MAHKELKDTIRSRVGWLDCDIEYFRNVTNNGNIGIRVKVNEFGRYNQIVNRIFGSDYAYLAYSTKNNIFTVWENDL